MGHDFVIFVILLIFGTVVNDVFTQNAQEKTHDQADLVLIEALQAPGHGSGVLFSVDSTVTYLVVDIENVTELQNCTAFGPNGTSPYPATDSNESRKFKKQIAVDTPSLGSWVLTCTDQQAYNVSVWGVSDVTLHVHFLDSSDEPISGDPIIGSNVTVGLEISGMEALEIVSSVEIVSESGRHIDVYPVTTQGAGRRHNFYRQNIIVPRKAFRVGFTAMDKQNVTVRRQTATATHPQTFTVTLSQVDGDSSPGTNITYMYCVHNHDNRNETFTVQILLDTLQPNDFQSGPTYPTVIDVPFDAERCRWFDVTISANSTIGTSCDVNVSIEGDNKNIEFAKSSLVVQRSTAHSTFKSDDLTSTEAITSRKSSAYSTSKLENITSTEAISSRKSTFVSSTQAVTSENTSTSSGQTTLAGVVTSNNTEGHVTFVNDVTSSKARLTFVSEFISSNTKSQTTSVRDVTSGNTKSQAIKSTKSAVTTVGSWITTQGTTQGISQGTAQTDVSPPAFSKVSFIDRCDERVQCSIRQWVVVFVVQDDESGVHQVTVEDTLHSVVQTDNFTDGLANVPIHGNVSTSCCQKEAVLDVVDMMGNTGRYHVTYQLPRNGTNGTGSGTTVTRHKLRDLAAIVVGICAGILVVIIVLTAIIQFQSNIASVFSRLKFRRPEKDVELRMPHKLSVDPRTDREGAAPWY